MAPTSKFIREMRVEITYVLFQFPYVYTTRVEEAFIVIYTRANQISRVENASETIAIEPTSSKRHVVPCKTQT